MKINNQYNKYGDTYNSQKTNENREKIKKSSSNECVEINLSNTSQKLRMEHHVTEIDNSQKIQDIKKAIKDGTYNVSSEEIADKIFMTLKGQE